MSAQIAGKDHSLIVLYHRITRLDTDPYDLAVTPEVFDAHLKLMSQYAEVVPLSELSSGNRGRKSAGRRIAITFDDGYRDNLEEAMPILENHRLPATFFIAAGCIDNTREFWWDDLERLLLSPGELPSELVLQVNKQWIRYRFSGSTSYSDAAWKQNRAWKTYDATTPDERHKALRFFITMFRCINHSQRLQLLDQLVEITGQPITGRNTHRTLTAPELKRLSVAPGVEIGAHTVNHPVLSALSPQEQQAEISGSKVQLEKLINQPLKGFAYPHGTRRDYSLETAKMVAEAGFSYGCSVSIPPEEANRFEMPRLTVFNWTEQELREQLNHFFKS